MKKLVNVSVLFGIVVLLMLLVVGVAGAASPLQVGPGEGEIEPEVEIEPGGEGEVEPEPGGEGEVEPEPEGGEVAEAEPTGAAVRINFEISGHQAKRGHYSVQLPGGAEVASWYALDGWEDSGWISNLDLQHGTELVEVLYYPGPETEPTVMTILNHAPGNKYGWLAQGMAHALEVAWPDQELVAEADENL